LPLTPLPIDIKYLRGEKGERGERGEKVCSNRLLFNWSQTKVSFNFSSQGECVREETKSLWESSTIPSLFEDNSKLTSCHCNVSEIISRHEIRGLKGDLGPVGPPGLPGPPGLF